MLYSIWPMSYLGGHDTISTSDDTNVLSFIVKQVSELAENLIYLNGQFDEGTL